MEKAVEWYNTGWMFLQVHTPEIIGSVVLLMALGVFMYRDYRSGMWEAPNMSPKRRGKMLRKARREYVKRLLVDDFVDRVEERVYAGSLTREEAKEAYRDLKKCFPVRDLFPSPELLKEMIQKRLGKHIEPNFPDKKIGKKRTMFDKVA